MPTPLIPLPAQPAGVRWPTDEWPEAALPGRTGVDADLVSRSADALLASDVDGPTARTHALLVVHHGEVVVERYDAEHDRDATLVSWSMAKSILHALVGTLVRDGRIDPGARAEVAAWQGEDDPRRAITLEQLLRMVDGLDFVEDYVDEGASNVIDMLFGDGKADVAGYVEKLPLAHPPGTRWNYSSGTSNIVSRILGNVIGGGAAGVEAHMRHELFDVLGMRSAKPRFDDAGTFIGSSFVFATARDFARFGLLYLRDGIWEGRRILPEGWVDHARTPTPASRGEYGAHFWLAMNGSGVFHCSGFNGQSVAIDPTRDLVVVRLGQSQPHHRGAVWTALERIHQAFPERR